MARGGIEALLRPEPLLGHRALQRTRRKGPKLHRCCDCKAATLVITASEERKLCRLFWTPGDQSCSAELCLKGFCEEKATQKRKTHAVFVLAWANLLELDSMTGGAEPPET